MKKTKSKTSSRKNSPHTRLSQLCKGIATEISSLGLDKADTSPTKSDLQKQERKKLFQEVQKQLKNLSK